MKFYTNSTDIDMVVDIGEYKILFPALAAYSSEELSSILGLPLDLLDSGLLAYACEKSGAYVSNIRFYPVSKDVRIIW